MIWFGLIALVLLLLVLRQNLIVILASVCVYCYALFGDGNLDGIVLDAWDALNKDVLLSIPLFILAGNLMSKGEIASRMIDVMKAVTAPIPGGLGVATVLSCAIFAAISGSGTVTLLAVGAVMYPAMIRAGYSKRYALGSLCAAGTLGIIIPPSIPMILYGIMTQTNIADLFIAGIGPGLLLTSLFVGYSLIVNRHMPASPFSLSALGTALKRGVWSLMLPVIILGGIYSGHFTATESAAVALVYALLVETLIHRNMGFKQVYDVVGETSKSLGALFPVLMFALALNVFLTYQQMPEKTVALMQPWFDSKVSFLLVTNVFLLALGCVMDIGSAILIMAPILQPLASAQGIDPIHFGVMMVVNLEIGYLTPPLGMNLIVAMTAFRESFWEICKAVIPFVAIMLGALLIVAFVPELSLFLVRD
jgi:C4-dicarboxylate transporter, DctM subunit